jgi:predicted nucleic acid-binding protein
MPGDFFDTNVLIYIASGNSDKAERTESLMRNGGMISIRVLNEVTNVARRKMRLSWGETHSFLSLIRGLLPVEPITIDTHETGLDLAQRYGLSTYDAMIVASALLAGCDRLWSEDMQDGMSIDHRLQIVDPFRDTIQ